MVLGKAGLKERAGADWPPRYGRPVQLQRSGSSEERPNPAHPALPLATAGDLISHWPKNGRPLPSARPQLLSITRRPHPLPQPQPPLPLPAQTRGSGSSSFIKTQSHNPANEGGAPPPPPQGVPGIQAAVPELFWSRGGEQNQHQDRTDGTQARARSISGIFQDSPVPNSPRAAPWRCGGVSRLASRLSGPCGEDGRGRAGRQPGCGRRR